MRARKKERERERDGRMVYCTVKWIDHNNVVGEYD